MRSRSLSVPRWWMRARDAAPLRLVHAARGARITAVSRSRHRPRIPRGANTLPADRAVLLFRFVPREADDPIDVTSFKATVDGVDRTAQFRVTSAEAWGTLGDTAAPAVAGGRVATGPHTIGARVCSARGVCGALTAVIDVRPWERTLEPNTTARPGAHVNGLTRSVRPGEPRQSRVHVPITLLTQGWLP